MTEADARAKFGDKVRTSTFEFEENDRAIAEGDKVGGVKLIIGKSDKILARLWLDQERAISCKSLVLR